jgi:hypothetical protein
LSILLKHIRMNSPFLHFNSLEQETQKDTDMFPAETMQESPFLINLRLDGERLSSDPRAEQFTQIMDELYDSEFENAIEDLLSEADDLKESNSGNGEYITNEYARRNGVYEYYAPLNKEMDHFFNQLISKGEQVDNRQGTLEELETFIDQYSHEGNSMTDIQENLFGGFKKWVGKVAGAMKKGVSTVGRLASKFGFGFLFGKIKKIAVKFLKGFLEKAISKLPAQYQGLAQDLSRKILPQSMSTAPAAAVQQDNPPSASEPIEAAQQEMNAAVAHLLTANNEMEWGVVERELDNANTLNEGPSVDIDAARQNFIQQLNELQDEADAQPQVEQFLPVVLTGLKFVLPIVGRQRVINWLSSIIAKLIQRFIGRENAKALSSQMVEKGFKLLNLETAPEEETQLGATAVAATVEETVRQLENFPPYVFEDRPAFERYVVDAFEQAAAANMPDVLNESVYKKHPSLRESNRLKNLVWRLIVKYHGKHRHHHKVKKLNEVIETELTPYIAEEVRTFGGTSLTTFLRDRMGITVNDCIPVKVHLFEGLPDTRLYQLAKYAEGIPSMGTSDRSAWMQFHPFTSIAAGLLTGEPGLGCRSENCLHKSMNASGHRYYYLEILGARPQFFAPDGKRPILRGITSLRIKFDFLSNEIGVNQYLSEADAQAVAISLRKNQPETAHLLLMMAIEEGLKNTFFYRQYSCIKIVHPNVIPGKRSGLAMDLVPPVVVNGLKEAMKNWVGQSLLSYLRNQAAQFVQAAEDYADGVTLSATLLSPPNFPVLRQMLSGTSAALTEALFAKAPADVLITAKPGKHD